MPRLLSDRLAELRRERAFDPFAWVEEKARSVNLYLRSSGLRGCVLGVSGGIDSALAAGVLAKAKAMDGSPMERIIGASLPSLGDGGVTGQIAATARGTEVCERFGLESATIDLREAGDLIVSASDAAFGFSGGPWARGQLIPILRTTVLYYATSLLAECGIPSLVVGTTNLDEGGWLGYFGKASDGMVDLQIISDLHKSEVRLAAASLGVPASVMEAVPSGDMHDGRCDEDVFGAPYDFVELFSWWLRLDASDSVAAEAWLSSLEAEPASAAAFKTWSSNLRALHAHNAHKYLGRSPAVHLDSRRSAIPGGWDNPSWSPSSAADE
jgi:NAD+ synthase (glutamine-hydrolysing)